MFRSLVSKHRNGTAISDLCRRPLRSAPITSTRAISIQSKSHRSRPIANTFALTDPRCVALVSRGSTGLTSFSTTPNRKVTGDGRDTKLEKDMQEKKMTPHPDEVTATSSVRAIVEESQAPPQADAVVKSGLQGDLNMIKETFALREVPKEVTFLGLAGLIPYALTSSTTLFLAWDVKNIHQYGTGWLFNEAQATNLLHFLEPVQVGYGAVILSFLGAIHWGLEFAKFGGSSPYRRYGLGILAPALAWPTVFMPYDYALLAQFGGFVGMYFADAQVTSRGWAPKWYTTYRFILTFVVGASIVVTLVGRGQIGDAMTLVSSPVGRVKELGAKQRMGLEEETGGKAYQDKLKEEEQARKENKKQEEEEEKKKQKEEEQKKKEEEEQKKKRDDDKKSDKKDTKGKDKDASKEKDTKDDKSKDSKDDKSENDKSKDGKDDKSKDAGTEAQNPQDENTKENKPNDAKPKDGQSKDDSEKKDDKGDGDKSKKDDSKDDKPKDDDSKDDKSEDEKSKDDKAKDDKPKDGDKKDKKDKK